MVLPKQTAPPTLAQLKNLQSEALKAAEDAAYYFLSATHRTSLG